MKINYKITEELQKKLAADGKNARATQTCELSNVHEKIRGIITDNDLVTISPDGEVEIDLTGEVLLFIDRISISAKKTDGAAAGYINRMIFSAFNRSPPNYRAAEMYHKYDYLINSTATLQAALNMIYKINAQRIAAANQKTAESLATFQARIDAYNFEHAEKRIKKDLENYKKAKIEIVRLKKQVLNLQEQTFEDSFY